MKCLDSDFLIGILRDNPDAVAKAHALDETGKSVTTAVNAFEILNGARISMKQKNIEEAKKLLAKLDVLSFDETTADKASQLFQELRKAGTPVGLRDVFTAAIALENGCTLVTRNIKDFSRIRGLETERW